MKASSVQFCTKKNNESLSIEVAHTVLIGTVTKAQPTYVITTLELSQMAKLDEKPLFGIVTMLVMCTWSARGFTL